MNNVLYHHGILGQKWGVRRYQNKDGSLTPEGKERYYKNLASDIRDRAASSRAYRKATDRMDKAYKEVRDYWNLPEETRDKYVRQAADNAHLKYGNDPLDQEEREQYYRAYKYDDLDQGADNSFKYYLEDRGIDPKKWSKKAYEAEQRWKKDMQDAVETALDDIEEDIYGRVYGDASINNASVAWDFIEDYAESNNGYARKVVNEIIRDLDKNESRSHGYWYNLLEM